jgi:hypothetical protein
MLRNSTKEVEVAEFASSSIQNCCSKDLFKTTMASLRSKYFLSYTYDEIGIKANVNEMNR